MRRLNCTLQNLVEVESLFSSGLLYNVQCIHILPDMEYKAAAAAGAQTYTLQGSFLRGHITCGGKAAAHIDL